MSNESDEFKKKVNGKLFYFNWKMNPSLFDEELVETYLKAQAKANSLIKIFPPDIFINKLIEKGISQNLIGLQNISHLNFSSGAYTGQISAKMASELCVFGAIVGHSEVRKYLNLNLNDLLQQTLFLNNENLNTIFCIGHEDSPDKDKVEEKAISDLAALLQFVKTQNLKPDLITIAYEPIWAIGTGKTATLENIEVFFTKIKSLTEGLNIKILYGGSVTSTNFETLNQSNLIDGYLIGGASLKIAELNGFFDLN